jgi:GTP cyclohydrolase I
MEAAKAVLRTGFKHDVVSEMVHISRVQFVSFCAHHLSPFLCTGYFAYVPDGIIVGLSKIPRTIEIVANRPQVQETLTDQVVEIFDATVKPRGCGFVVDAVHMCMVSRGIKKSGISVRTSALRGCFFEAATKQEFFSAIPRSS